MQSLANELSMEESQPNQKDGLVAPQDKFEGELCYVTNNIVLRSSHQAIRIIAL